MEGLFERRRRLGSVEIIDLPPLQDAPLAARIRRRYLCRWHPPYQIKCELPPWFDLALECWEGPDQIRRFSPPREIPAEACSDGLRFVSKSDVLTLLAATGGDRLLRDQGVKTSGICFGFDEARVFMLYARHLREYLGPTRRMANALSVCAGENFLTDERTILPSGLSLSELRKDGIAAQASSAQSLSLDDMFRLGLFEAAKRNPLYLTPKEVAPIIRMLLFAPGPTGIISPSGLRYVAQCARKSLHGHLNDTDEDFRNWIEDPKSNLIHQISKSSKGKLSRPEVRSALLELGWRAFQSTGQCIDTQMRTFRDALPLPLNEREKHLFDLSYLATPHLGRIPLPLLSHRLGFLREAWLHLWNQPGKDALAILYRMMYYYSQLVNNRRDVDRHYKSRRRFTPDSKPIGNSFNVDNENVRCAIQRLALERGLDCDFPHDNWEFGLANHKDGIEININCADSPLPQTFVVDREQLERIASKK